MRAFLALELDPVGRQALGDWQRSALRSPKLLRPVDSNHAHVTLWFFADLPPARAQDLVQRLDADASLATPIATRVAGFGGFPSARRATVLVAKLLDEQGTIAAEHERCSLLCAALGFPPDSRPFVPHVTLARLAKATDVGPWLRDPSDVPPFCLERLTLFRSELTPTGARYERLGTWPHLPPHDAAPSCDLGSLSGFARPTNSEEG